MIIVQAPPPKRRSFFTTWLPWILFLGVILAGWAFISNLDDGKPNAPQQSLEWYRDLIRANGFNCPAARRLDPQAQDAHGRVIRVTCDPAMDFRVTWLANDRGMRVEPWR